MAAHELDRICGTIVSKLMLGERLSADERSHLVESTECMLEVVRRLDEQRAQALHSNGTGCGGTDCGSKDSELADRNKEVAQALERSRGAFVREFGLS
jgi:hypothetical protein